MATIRGNYCGNCQYWGGNRKVSYFKDSVEVKTGMEKVQCLNKNAGMARGIKQTNGSAMGCRGFEKWDQLK